MARPKPGIPDDFEVEVEDDDFDAENVQPVRLGDRLKEERRIVELHQQEETRASASEPAPAPEEPAPAPPRARAESPPARRPLPDPEPRPARPEKRRAKRADLSITSSDLSLLDDLVDDLRRFGPQRDASRAEVIAGLVRLGHRARDHHDFSAISSGRGVKGSATHDAFREEIGHVLERGIRNSPDKSFED